MRYLVLSELQQNPQVLGYFVAAIGTLSGVVGLLGKWILSKLGKDISTLETKVTALETKVDEEKTRRESSDLKALRAEIAAQLPCQLPVCPKRNATSFSIGEAGEKLI